MKKFTFSFLSLFVLFTSYAGIGVPLCTPDSASYLGLEAGFYPDFDSMPCIVVGQYYEETVHFTIPDTVSLGPGLNFALETIEVESLTNIPCNIEWSANKPSLIYQPGEVGCATFFGTSCENPGQFELAMIVTACFVPGTPIPCLESVDASGLGIRYFLRVINPGDTCPPVDTLAVSDVASASCPCVGCETPEPISTSNIGINQATLNWTSQPGADHYVITGNRADLPIGGVTLPINNPVQTSFTTNILDPGTDYHWRIKTCCDAAGTDCSDWSVIEEFSTSCQVPNPISTTNITQTTCRLNWAPVDGSSGYGIRGRVCGASGWVTLTKNGGNTSGHNVPAILSPCTCYEWEVRSLCRGMDGRKSNWTGLTTFTTLCSKNGETPTEFLEMEYDLNLVPNPAKDKVRVSLSGTFGVSDLPIRIININGKEVFNGILFGNELIINTGELASGVYQVVAGQNKSAKVERLLITK